jgi:hypothetical protein
LESKDIYYSLPQSISPSSKFDNWTRNQKYSVLGKPKYTETLIWGVIWGVITVPMEYF